MPRYRAIGPADVKNNRRYRVRVAHRSKDFTLTAEGKVTRIHLDNDNIPGAVEFDPYSSSIAVKSTSFWRVERIDEVYPDLPTTAGSVAVVDGKTIILVPDSGGGEVAPFGKWVYALDMGKQVPWADLNEADVLHDAGA